MSALMELLEFLNECSGNRAAAYMFFMTTFTYLTLNVITKWLVDLVFVLKGYKKEDDEDDDDEDNDFHYGQ